MLPDPLHPAIVHMPLALSVLLPFAVIFAIWAVRDSARTRPVWAVVVALTAILAISARVAVLTGQDQEEKVEDVVPHDPFEEHEEAGEQLFVIAAVVLVLAAGGLMGGKVGDVARSLTVLGSVIVLVAALRVGKLGGELVYEHGAASAYAGTTPPGVTVGRDEESEDEERESRR